MRILIVSEYFAPAQGIGALRWTKMSKYLTKDPNIVVDVLTNRKCFDSRLPFFAFEPYFQYRSDPNDTLEQDISELHRFMYAKRGITTLFANAVRNLKMVSKKDNAPTVSAVSNEEKKENLLKSEHFSIKDRVNNWRNYAAANDALRTIRAQHEPYDVLITSFGPFWPHIVGRELKKNNSDLMWIADYRDFPLVGGCRSCADEAKMLDLTSTADVMTIVSPCDFQLIDSRIQIIPNGFDPSDCKDYVKRDKTEKFIISYTGALYDNENGKSDLRPVMKALSDLIENGEISSNNVEVVYAGGTETIFNRQLEQFPLVPRISYGNLPRYKALEIQRHSSILLLTYWGSNGYECPTGKIYEYVTSGTPIIAICSSECKKGIVSYLIEKGGAGVTYSIPKADQQSYLQLKNYIKSLYYKWLERGFTTVSIDKNIVSQFDYSNLSKYLLSICMDFKEGKK